MYSNVKYIVILSHATSKRWMRLYHPPDAPTSQFLVLITFCLTGLTIESQCLVLFWVEQAASPGWLDKN
jgi:hypothetical protein